jgi:hypothetical protein
MSGKTSTHNSYRSFFWPVILIAAGVIWLLSNISIIPTENLWILFRLWPVLIIVAGLDLLFARRLPLVGALLALLVAAGVVGILLRGSEFDIQGQPEPRLEMFELAAGHTTSLYFDLNLSSQDTLVYSLVDSPNLIEAEVYHFGDVEFMVSGGENKRVKLEQTGILSWFSWVWPEDGERASDWLIGLSSAIPIDLKVDASTGHTELDLAGSQLNHLWFNGSTGASTIILPASLQSYDARFEASTGAMDVTFPPESNINIRLDGSVGRIVLNVPDGAVVRVEVLSGGRGRLLMPEWLTKIDGRQDRDEGIYQTTGFEDAHGQLVIIIENIGIGDIIIE